MASMKYSYRRPFYSTWDPLTEISNRVSGLFEEPFFESRSSVQWSPRFNLSESADDLNLSVELPGVSKEDICIVVENNVLKLTGEKVSTGKAVEGDSVTHVRERNVGSFTRSVRLPRTVDSSKISAELKNGVLEVRLPKAAESKGRQIPIKT